MAGYQMTNLIFLVSFCNTLPTPWTRTKEEVLREKKSILFCFLSFLYKPCSESFVVFCIMGGGAPSQITLTFSLTGRQHLISLKNLLVRENFVVSKSHNDRNTVSWYCYKIPKHDHIIQKGVVSSHSKQEAYPEAYIWPLNLADHYKTNQNVCLIL